MIACLIYFSLAFLIYKWLFVHVYEDEFDCAGELWPPVFGGLVAGMFFGILSVCGLASVYADTDVAGIWVMWFLPFGLLYFYYDCVNTFGEMSRVMPFQDAVDIDRGA